MTSCHVRSNWLSTLLELSVDQVDVAPVSRQETVKPPIGRQSRSRILSKQTSCAQSFPGFLWYLQNSDDLLPGNWTRD